MPTVVYQIIYIKNGVQKLRLMPRKSNQIQASDHWVLLSNIYNQLYAGVSW